MEVYSEKQLALLQVLGDGEKHTKIELHMSCGLRTSPTNQKSTLDVHLSVLRKKLLQETSDGSRLNIVPIYEAKEVTYQLIRQIPATLKDIKSLH